MCFFQVNLPKNQRDLFRLLWFENNDIKKRKIIPFRFRCHSWGIKSSSVVASWAIRETLKHNVTKASDMTLDTNRGGAWEAMVKQFKLIFERILQASLRKPNIVELIIFCSNGVRIVNKRPITPLSDDPEDFTVITPASLLTSGFDKSSPIGVAHNKDHLRRD